MLHNGILGRETNFEYRHFSDFQQVADMVAAIRKLGQRIVLTSGTYDLVHLGHLAYLEKARSFGDFLIVGIDSDEKVKSRKGQHRPVVSEYERACILAHMRHVDMIVLKPLDEEPRRLLRTVHPDVLVVSETTGHEDGDIEEMKRHCGEVRLLEPQGETSTTARTRLLMVGGLELFTKNLQEAIPGVMTATLEEVSGKRAGKS